MTYEINETHDPNLKSWVESANDPNTDFPIQNLPFCAFRHQSNEHGSRLGVRIGDSVVDLEELSGSNPHHWWLTEPRAWQFDSLRRLAPNAASEIRSRLSSELKEGVSSHVQERIEHALISSSEVL